MLQLLRWTKMIRHHLDVMFEERSYRYEGKVRTYRVVDRNTLRHTERRIKRRKRQWAIVNRIQKETVKVRGYPNFFFPKVEWHWNPFSSESVFTKVEDLPEKWKLNFDSLLLRYSNSSDQNCKE